jgi:hypothetical protein
VSLRARIVHFQDGIIAERTFISQTQADNWILTLNFDPDFCEIEYEWVRD